MNSPRNRVGLCALVGFLLAQGLALALDAAEYGARGDGRHDDSSAIQAALDAAADKGDAVYLAAGQYRVTQPLRIPWGVRLEGVSGALHASHVTKGTTLLLYWGRGDETTSAAITMAEGSCLQGLTLYYPEQKLAQPAPYSWTLQARGTRAFVTNPPGSAQHVMARDVVIANAWQAIDFGTYHNEGHSLRDVGICALKTGVYIDNCSDVGRIENVHVHGVYWWRALYPEVFDNPMRAQLSAYTRQHLTGFRIGRCDWLYMSGCFVIWARVGFHFVPGNPRPGYKMGYPNALIVNSGSDVGPLAVLIEQVQAHAGVAFENCQFMGGLEIEPDNVGPVKLTNSGFWGEPRSGSQIIKRDGGTLTLTATHFSTWDQDQTGRPCIEASAGQLTLQGCEFRGNPTRATSPHLWLNEGLASAILLGNTFQAEGIRLRRQMKAEPQLIGNAIVSPTAQH